MINHQKQPETIISLIGIPGLGDVFRAMDIAEEVIAYYKHKYPEKKEEIHDAFQYLCLRGIPLTLYRAHARELLDRIVNKDLPLENFTDAEICWKLNQISTRVPLNMTGTHLYAWLFSRCVDNHIVDHIFEGLHQYLLMIDGSHEDLYNAMKKKKAVEKRSVREE